MEQMIIRNEMEADYREVEEVTRAAFWNLYVPGCHEHYVAHKLRRHQDFIPQLDFVAEHDGRIIGNIMYTKAKLVDDAGHQRTILTFGPLCVLPGYQRKGIGKQLMEHSFRRAAELGYDVIVIFGSPANYVSSGFKSCKQYNISLEGGSFPTAMLVRELKPGALDGTHWVYYGSPAMEVDEEECRAFDRTFEPMEQKYQPSQDEFFIYSHSVIADD